MKVFTWTPYGTCSRVWKLWHPWPSNFILSSWKLASKPFKISSINISSAECFPNLSATLETTVETCEKMLACLLRLFLHFGIFMARFWRSFVSSPQSGELWKRLHPRCCLSVCRLLGALLLCKYAAVQQWIMHQLQHFLPNWIGSLMCEWEFAVGLPAGTGAKKLPLVGPSGPEPIKQPGGPSHTRLGYGLRVFWAK